MDMSVARNCGMVAKMLWMPRYMPAIPSSASRSDCWLLVMGEGTSSGIESGSSDMRDISTSLFSVVWELIAGVEAEGESLLISSPMIARGAQPYMAQDLGIEVSIPVLCGSLETYAPQRAMRVVANRNDVENGARIIEAANASCDTAHAEVISIWYRWKSVAIRVKARGAFGIGRRALSSEGNDTRKGRKIELVNDMMEKRTNASEPFRAISPTMSFVVCSLAALSAFWR